MILELMALGNHKLRSYFLITIVIINFIYYLMIFILRSMKDNLDNMIQGFTKVLPDDTTT